MALVARLVAAVVHAKLLVASVHGGPKISPIRAYLQKRAFGGVDLVHVTGKRDRARIASITGRPVFWQPSGVADLFYLPNSVSSADSGAGQSPPLIAVVAVLRQKKNIDLVLDIACLLTEAQFVIAGDGPERERLQARVAVIGLENVVFVGQQTRYEIAALYRRSQIFLCTSLVEGTPTAMLEAMACGVPVVTSNCNDLSDIVQDGRTGFVLSGFSALDYAEALRRLLADPETLRRMSGECRRLASDFAWPKVAQNITEQIVTALERKHSVATRESR